MKSETNSPYANPTAAFTSTVVREWRGAGSPSSAARLADARSLSGGLHLWQAALNRSATQIELFRKYLARDELCRADRFHSEKDRRHFIVGRGLLRVILGHYLDVPPEQLRFRYSAQGKPLLESSFDQSLCFNLSHSHELVVYGIARGRQIGIDLEFVRPLADADMLAKRYFSEEEYAEFRSYPDEQKNGAFFARWTRLESYAKANGEGLTSAFADFDGPVGSGIPGDAARWMLEALDIGDGYVGALAVERPDGRLR